MANIPSPLRFVPFLRPMVWGGRKLETQLHKVLPGEGPFGESWEISDHPLHESVVAAGPLAGTTLRDLMRQHAREIVGEDADNNSRFPWLLKFLDANDWLSVQVHPGDESVERLWPGECGKTEAWFVLAAEPKSRIYAGLLPGVGREDFRKGLARGDVAKLLHSFTPKPGDCVLLPAGTVHALGGGVLLAEIQQTSDATFRLFDWNRLDRDGKPRKLHMEEGLAAIDWKRGPVTAIHAAEFARPFSGASGLLAQALVRCPYFQLSFVKHARPFVLGGRDVMQVMIVLAGQVAVKDETMTPGQTWLLPACLQETTFVPQPFVACLLGTLPKMDPSEGERDHEGPH